MSITAWRYWKIGFDGYDFATREWDWTLSGDVEPWDGPLKVAGIHTPGPWNVLVGSTTISSGPATAHQAPVVGCLCGVNAVKRIRSRDLVSRAANRPTFFGEPRQDETVVFGQVELGGRVEEYEEGYRAQQALIAGPLYVVNPPAQPGWQTAIERKYSTLVITQDVDEALKWVREDEEANGHRETHQDSRTGTAGGSFYPGGTITTQLSVNAGAFNRAFAGAQRALQRAYLGAWTGEGERTGPRVDDYHIYRDGSWPWPYAAYRGRAWPYGRLLRITMTRRGAERVVQRDIRRRFIRQLETETHR